MKTLIFHSLETLSAKKLALDLSGEVELRKNHYRIHTKKDFDIESYRLSSDIDLNIFDNNFDYQNIALMVSDMDSTLITVETIDEVAKEVGLKEEISLITEEAMQGQLDFTDSFKKRLSILKGTNHPIFESVYRDKVKFSPGAEELINYFKSNQIKTAVVSGGLKFFAEKIKSQLGIENFRANDVETINQTITGNIIGNVIDAKEKAKYIGELCDQYKLKENQVIAIGDGANDIEMMKIAGLSVAYHAKPLLKQYCNIHLNFGSLRSLIDFFEET
jgi:phosphoserine phosphatase